VRKLIALILALVFLSGCALSTVKPYRAKKQAKPAKKSLIKTIIQPIKKSAPVVEAEEIK